MKCNFLNMTVFLDVFDAVLIVAFVYLFKKEKYAVGLFWNHYDNLNV